MLPNTENLDDLILDFEEVQEKTKTFGINKSDGKRIAGMIDGLKALEQHIYLTLSVEADQFIIYPYTYGIRTLDLFGKPYHYVMAIIPERIKEALLDDDRINDVSNFEFEIEANRLTVRFVVYSIYGELNEETVVNY